MPELVVTTFIASSAQAGPIKLNYDRLITSLFYIILTVKCEYCRS